MDEQATRQALRSINARMPRADIEALVVPVTQAWNDHISDNRLQATIAVIRDATWPPGHAAGVHHGTEFVTHFFAHTARLTLADTSRLDPGSQRLLRSIAGIAAAVEKAPTTVTDPGPSHRELDVALMDITRQSDADRAADAARVGWTHGFHAGDADGAWSATRHMLTAIEDLLGEAGVARATIDGVDGHGWLQATDIDARRNSEQAIRVRSTTAQAFPRLRALDPTAAADMPAPTAGNVSNQRRGPHR
jgi:hypothetical protein